MHGVVSPVYMDPKISIHIHSKLHSPLFRLLWKWSQECMGARCSGELHTAAKKISSPVSITPGGPMESRSYAQPCHGGQQSHQSPSDVSGNTGSVLEVAQSSSCLPLHTPQPWASAAPPQSWESSSARLLSAFYTVRSPIVSFTNIALSWNFLMFLHL